MTEFIKADYQTTKSKSGRTTRQINNYIEEFFENKGAVVVKDHHGTREATDYLAKRMKYRLILEHGVNVMLVHLNDNKIEIRSIVRE